jgi:hypothetical protein
MTTKQLKQSASQRGIKIQVVSRALSDYSTVYSVQALDRYDGHINSLLEVDCVSANHARALCNDLRVSMAKNAIVQLL